MKEIKKEILDELIQESIAHWNRALGSPNEKRFELSKRLSAECGVDWLNICHFIDAIVSPLGLAQNAPESAVYSALQAMGWEVR